MNKGKVKFFNKIKGFGFIEQEVGDDMFFHFSEITDMPDGERILYDDDLVEFEVGEGRKGPMATNIRFISRL